MGRLSPGFFRGFFTTVKYCMEYKLYTLVDITHTGQYRSEPGKENFRWKEQNFNTVLQTLGIRANVEFRTSPVMTEVKGRLIGFDTDEIIRVWRFDFSTDRDHMYELDGDPVGALNEDFMLVPYIAGLDEAMEQRYAVFNTSDPGKNIVFYCKG
jgi:hypothetical protein